MEMMKYFFECCFNVSEDYRDLNFVIERFKKEKAITQEKLIQELRFIIETSHYEKAQKYIEEYGLREMSLSKTKVFIKFLYDKLCDIPTNVTPNDFYKIK